MSDAARQGVAGGQLAGRAEPAVTSAPPRITDAPAATPESPRGLRIQLLGDFRVTVGDRVVEEAAWRLRKARSLVKLLALAPGHALHRDQLLDLLWPTLEVDAAGNNLRYALHVARRVLEPDGSSTYRYCRVQGDLLVLASADGLWTDVEAFEAAAASARQTREPAAYHAAVGLYGGDLLPGDRYEDWAAGRREELRALYLGLLRELARIHEARGEFDPAREALLRVIAGEPSHEEAHVGLMRLYALAGQRHQALRQYQQLREALRRELDADVDPATRLFYDDIVAGRFPGDPASATPGTPTAPVANARRQPPTGPRARLASTESPAADPRATASRHDLASPATGRPATTNRRGTPGQAAPARVATAPPAPTHPATPREGAPSQVQLSGVGGARSGCPIPLASLVGRSREIAGVAQALTATRLVTLTGPGGIGKTRVALQVAAEIADTYGDGVWFVDLASVTAPDGVLSAIAAALGLHAGPGASVVEAVVGDLRRSHHLLVLDTCEHVEASCAAVVDTLLRACPRLTVLATSRHVLGIAGETVWRIPPLDLPAADTALPAPEALTQYAAVELFVERARLARPDFALTPQTAPIVLAICRRLDGLPLAIELAAAWVKVLAVERIAARLDDRFRLLTVGSRVAAPRHQTLRAAMDWTYALLSARERMLLQRLAVLPDSWTLEAAEAIAAGPDLPADDILGVLSALVDKSLVDAASDSAGDVRYRILDTVREYARERGPEAGRATPSAACASAPTAVAINGQSASRRPNLSRGCQFATLAP